PLQPGQRTFLPATLSETFSFLSHSGQVTSITHLAAWRVETTDGRGPAPRSVSAPNLPQTALRFQPGRTCGTALSRRSTPRTTPRARTGSRACRRGRP